MSTLAYAAITTKREEGDPNKTSTTSPPGVGTFVDALSALVPAEVLTLHAVILSVTTKTAGATTTITESRTLIWSFCGLILLSALIYVGYRLLSKKWDRLDYIRMLIPPLSFIGWTMIQRATAFDAVFPNLAEAPRTVLALFLGVILGLVAAALGYKADQKPVPN
jgi:hypothetical protein